MEIMSSLPEKKLSDFSSREIPIFEPLEKPNVANFLAAKHVFSNFFSHYNFLLEKIGKPPRSDWNLEDPATADKYFAAVFFYLGSLVSGYSGNILESIESLIRSGTMTPGSIVQLEVTSEWSQAKLCRSVIDYFELEKKGVRSELCRESLRRNPKKENYLDWHVPVWVHPSRDGTKVYVTQDPEVLIPAYFIEFLDGVHSTFSWVGFIAATGGAKFFPQLIESYAEFLHTLEMRGWHRRKSQLFSLEEFAHLFTDFRVTAGQKKPSVFPYGWENDFALEFLELWGGGEALYRVFLDLFLFHYLAVSSSIRIDYDYAGGEGLSFKPCRENEDILRYVYEGKLSFFFLWDFVLNRTIGDCFVSPTFYSNFRQGDLVEEFSHTGEKRRRNLLGPWYGKKLHEFFPILEEEREEVFFFVNEAKNRQNKIETSPHTYCESVWPIFCFSTHIDEPFGGIEGNADVNGVLLQVLRRPCTVEEVTVTSYFDRMMAKLDYFGFFQSLDWLTPDHGPKPNQT